MDFHTDVSEFLPVPFVLCKNETNGFAKNETNGFATRGLPPPTPSTNSALAVVDGPFDSGDTLLEGAVREQISSGRQKF